MPQHTYWNKSAECMSREELTKLQLTRLRRTVMRVYQNVPYYRARMQAADLSPEDIHSVSDLARMPFTYKDDLRDNYPFGLFAAPAQEIVRIHASSGTTGKPTVVGYTAKDIDCWSEMMARSMGCAGGGRNDIVQVAYGYGLFTGGLGAHYGAERMGASVIPISGGNTQRQLMLMQDFGSTLLACTPSYALMLGEARIEAGLPLENFKLRAGVFGAEPWTEGMRKRIEEVWGIDALDIYGLSEIMGPGVSMECMEKDGMHIWEDHFIPEIIDPDTGEVLPIGERGELVFTTITKEGLPLIRYRTHDVTQLEGAPCACGRTHIRMRKVTGRTDDMLIIRGVNVFPSQIETVLTRIPEVRPHYMIYVDRVHNADTLEVQVEISEEFQIDQISQMEALTKKITNAMHQMLGLTCKITLVNPKTIARSEGKAKRVIDNRVL